MKQKINERESYKSLETFLAFLIMFSPNFLLLFENYQAIYFKLIIFYNAVVYYQIIKKFRSYYKV